jgi:hypothetical protein
MYIVGITLAKPSSASPRRYLPRVGSDLQVHGTGGDGVIFARRYGIAASLLSLRIYVKCVYNVGVLTRATR